MEKRHKFVRVLSSLFFTLTRVVAAAAFWRLSKHTSAQRFALEAAAAAAQLPIVKPLLMLILLAQVSVLGVSNSFPFYSVLFQSIRMFGQRATKVAAAAISIGKDGEFSSLQLCVCLCVASMGFGWCWPSLVSQGRASKLWQLAQSFIENQLELLP